MYKEHSTLMPNEHCTFIILFSFSVTVQVKLNIPEINGMFAAECNFRTLDMRCLFRVQQSKYKRPFLLFYCLYCIVLRDPPVILLRSRNSSWMVVTSEVELSGDHLGECPVLDRRFTSENGIPDTESNAPIIL